MEEVVTSTSVRLASPPPTSVTNEPLKSPKPSAKRAPASNGSVCASVYTFCTRCETGRLTVVSAGLENVGDESSSTT